MQTLYALLAMALVALLSLTVASSSRRSSQRMAVSEVSTQASGVAIDVIEQIARAPFDVATDTSKVSVWPPVSSAAGLTAEADFGGCAYFNTCESVEEFDGVTFDYTRDGFTYGVSIVVRYVDEDNPNYQTGSQTFAKQVTVDIASPHLQIGAAPAVLRMQRVITYDKVTDP